MSRDNCAISCCYPFRGTSGVALFGFNFNIRVLCQLEKKNSSYDHEDAVDAGLRRQIERKWPYCYKKYYPEEKYKSKYTSIT